MREILFRGKQVYSGEWLYGMPDNEDCSADFPCISPSRNYHTKDTFPLDWEVDPETVGQFTGLTDRNGKKIFEGDMLKPLDDEIDRMVVEFHHGAFVLCLYGERGYMGEGGWVEEGNYGVFECEPLSSYGDDVEVIGNIHDNPELLEAQS